MGNFFIDMDFVNTFSSNEFSSESPPEIPQNVSVLPEAVVPIVRESRENMEKTGILDMVNEKAREEVEKLKQIISRSIPPHLKKYWKEIETKIFVGTSLFLIPEIAEGNWGSDYWKERGTIVGENSFQEGWDSVESFLVHEVVIAVLLAFAGHIKGSNDGGRFTVDNMIWFFLGGEASRILTSQIPYVDGHAHGYVSAAIFGAIAVHAWMKNL